MGGLGRGEKGQRLVRVVDEEILEILIVGHGSVRERGILKNSRCP